MLCGDRLRPSTDIEERADRFVREFELTLNMAGNAYHDPVLKLHASQRQWLEQLGWMRAIRLWVRRGARRWCLSGGEVRDALCCHILIVGGEVLVCSFQDVMMLRHIERLALWFD